MEDGEFAKTLKRSLRKCAFRMSENSPRTAMVFFMIVPDLLSLNQSSISGQAYLGVKRDSKSRRGSVQRLDFLLFGLGYMVTASHRETALCGEGGMLEGFTLTYQLPITAS